MGEQGDVAEPGEGVRLAAVVAGGRPVDGLVGRAVVGRRTLLVEPTARRRDDGPVDLDLGLGQREALGGQRLAVHLDQALDQAAQVRRQVGVAQRRLGRSDLDPAGDLRPVQVHRVQAVPRQAPVRPVRLGLRPRRGRRGAGASAVGSVGVGLAIGAEVAVAEAVRPPAGRRPGWLGPEPEPADQLEADDQGEDDRGRRGRPASAGRTSDGARGGRTPARPRNPTRDESRVGAVKAPAEHREGDDPLEPPPRTQQHREFALFPACRSPAAPW